MENKTTILNTNQETIANPVFLLFAEFFGYVSPLIDIAENICEGKEISLALQKLIDVEAKVIFHEMQQEFTISEIQKNYQTFYPVILQEYDAKLKENLPF